MRRVLTLIASGLYLGFLPLAPATFGSLWALPIWYFLRGNTVAYVAVTFVILVLGIIISAELTRSEESDPRYIVIDEIVGLLIAISPLVKFDWRLFLIAFLLFRILDIIKPFPIRQSERIGSGIGVMIDDVFAGGYAAIGVFLAKRFLFHTG